MSAYQKGYRAELELIHIFERKGYVSIRSAGSKTPVDILVGNGKQTLAIQVKTGKRKSRVDEEELREYARMLKAAPVIARKVPYRGWKMEYLKEKSG